MLASLRRAFLSISIKTSNYCEKKSRFRQSQILDTKPNLAWFIAESLSKAFFSNSTFTFTFNFTM